MLCSAWGLRLGLRFMLHQARIHTNDSEAAVVMAFGGEVVAADGAATETYPNVFGVYPVAVDDAVI